MKTHPVAELFPMLDSAALHELAADIEANGLQHPLVRQGDTLLDGRNRLAACKLAGVEPTFTEYAGDSPVAYIMSVNLHRRHLEKGQLAALGVELEPHFAAEARQRMERGRPKEGVAIVPQDTGKARDKAAAAVGVSGKMVSDAKAIKRDDPKLFERVRTGEITVPQAKREQREAVRETRRQANAVAVAQTPDPIATTARFATILVDPPWDWGDEGDVNQLGRAKPDYATMSIDQLRQLPLARLADVDCHLYMWITNRSLPKGFDLLNGWGFRFITALTWPKKSFGMGTYFRGQTEHLLFGVRGSQSLTRKDASTLLPAWDRGPDGHSSKPVEIYGFIESCSPGPYLEMFARQKRDGWAAWGADAK